MVDDRRTKIVATIGPSSETPERLRALVAAGMNAARLNLSHGSHEEHARRVQTIRDVEAESGKPIALIADLQGPKLRIGALDEPVLLARGDEITVAAEEQCLNGELPIAPAVVGDVPTESDAVMVARGDLGVEVGAASVPLLQKRIILKALERGKPVITATQMLESMINSPEPTRAEASDVANAILDGTSAIMLSGETAVGEYPVEAVAYMDRIARAVEPSMDYRHQLPDAADNPTIGQAMSNAACDLAEALQAKAILVPTFSGRTANAVARLRPRRPIVALTHVDWAMRQLALEWGVTALEISETGDVEDRWRLAVEAAREAGIVESGDRVVITAGTAVNIPGTTNVIKVDVVV